MKNIVTIEQTCFACPSQWNITTDDGAEYLAHFRHNCFSVWKQGERSAIYQIANVCDANGADGVMSQDVMLVHFKRAMQAEAEQKAEA